jgi:transposase
VGGQPDYGDCRQSKRQERAKRGTSLEGFDADKVKGRKQHILVDTLGLLSNVAVHPASK